MTRLAIAKTHTITAKRNGVRMLPSCLDFLIPFPPIGKKFKPFSPGPDAPRPYPAIAWQAPFPLQANDRRLPSLAKTMSGRNSLPDAPAETHLCRQGTAMPHDDARTLFPRGLIQPRDGFRFGSDALLLASFAATVPGRRVLDLGTGSGPAGLGLLLARDDADTTVLGLDIAPDMTQAAKANAARLGLAERFAARCLDVRDIRADADTAAESFDLVLAAVRLEPGRVARRLVGPAACLPLPMPPPTPWSTAAAWPWCTWPNGWDISSPAWAPAIWRSSASCPWPPGPTPRPGRR
jgi:hypothetical protein